MKLLRMFLLLLSFSLIVQNTCPYGFAAKTAFAAQHTHQCPFHRYPHKGQGAVDDNSNKVIYPAFAMVAPFVQPSIHYFPESTDYFLFSSDRYSNPFKKPLIKPPVA
jgi:hypothetical protein